MSLHQQMFLWKSMINLVVLLLLSLWKPLSGYVFVKFNTQTYKSRVHPSICPSIGPSIHPVLFLKVKSTHTRHILCCVSALVFPQSAPESPSMSQYSNRFLINSVINIVALMFFCFLDQRQEVPLCANIRIWLTLFFFVSLISARKSLYEPLSMITMLLFCPCILDQRLGVPLWAIIAEQKNS